MIIDLLRINQSKPARAGGSTSLTNVVPTELYHYFEAGTPPFRSLSELSDTDFALEMERIGEQPIKTNRFTSPEMRRYYLYFRRQTERLASEKFSHKGGRPEIEAPRYLTLGPVKWFYDWYTQADEVRLPIGDLDPLTLSFTYPDSMTSFLLAEGSFEPYKPFAQPHHGEVFTLQELPALIQELGMPDEDDPINQQFGNRIVEAQLWSLAPLSPWI